MGAVRTYFLYEPYKPHGIAFFLDGRPIVAHSNPSRGLAIDPRLDAEEGTLLILLVQRIFIYCLCNHEVLCLVIQNLHGIVNDIIAFSILSGIVCRVLLCWNEGFEGVSLLVRQDFCQLSI